MAPLFHDNSPEAPGTQESKLSAVFRVLQDQALHLRLNMGDFERMVFRIFVFLADTKKRGILQFVNAYWEGCDRWSKSCNTQHPECLQDDPPSASPTRNFSL